MPKLWKSIPSQPSFEVSSSGMIRHLFTKRDRDFWIGKTGYVYVSLRKNGNGRSYPFLVHRMVAEAFLGPCPKGQEVRHLDGDPGNNHYKNLKYGTAKENGEDKKKHGRAVRGEDNGNAKAPDNDVAEMRRLYAARLLNQYQIADKFGISQAQVNNILLMKQRTEPAHSCM